MEFDAEIITDLMPPVNPQDTSLTCEDCFGVHSLIREGFAWHSGAEGRSNHAVTDFLGPPD